MKKLTALLFIIVLIGSGIRARADEGMWLLPLIEKLNIGKMTELGLKLSAEDIYSLNKACLKDAVVSIPGCTGEIVSSQGLLLTNHHCGYGAIQSHSTVEHDYLKDGFWAMSKEEELPSPDMFANFLIRIEDVTAEVMATIKAGMSEDERGNAIREISQVIQRRATEGNGYNARVTNFYSGNYYYLLVYERYTDVRLVGAPPSSVGKFGFDTDNWEWPRHTGDFSIFRVYSGPDGKPAPYSKNNIPLKPKYYLPVSIKDLNEGDFSMILGYPGRTYVYYTSWEIDETYKIINPNRIKIRGVKQDIWMADMQADKKVNIQYASKYAVSSNYWKFSIGQNKGFENLNVKAKKQMLEDQFNKWIEADPARKAKYGEALNMIKTSIERRAEFANAQQYISECFTQGCELLGLKNYTDSLVSALRAGDAKKISDEAAAVKNEIIDFYKDYNAPTDQKAMKALMKLFRESVPQKFHPGFFVDIIDKKFKGSIDKFVDDMFAKSIFSDQTRLNAFLDKPVLKILENDPVYLTQTSITSVLRDVRREYGRFDANLTPGRRLWIAALMEMAPEKTLYPDANSTMRLTYGSILDYDPKDGVTYKYYTTTKGIIEKYKPGDYEFDVPVRLIDLIKNKQFGRYASPKGYLPVCFLTNNHSTGGNSGSPVLNANGELIGLDFDGNWESLSGDFAFEPDLQRCIVVDIRYVLWIIDVYAGAGHLVDEMTIRQ